MKKLVVVCSALALMALTACTSVQPIGATGVAVGSKVGESTGTWVFGLPSDADYSIQTAAKNGGISTISTIDVKTVDYLGFYTIRTTIVTGE